MMILCIGFVASAQADSDVVKKSKKAHTIKVKKADRAVTGISRRAQVQALKEQIAAVESTGSDATDLLNQLRDLRGPRPNRSGSPRLDAGGEDCATAFDIASLPFNDSGNNSGNVDDYDAECGSTGGKDVVYTYTPAVNQTIIVASCGSDYDTVLDIYNHCPTDTSNTVACSDDDCGDLQSCVSFDALTGTTYYIILDGYSSGEEGNYLFSVNEGYDCPCADFVIDELPFCDEEYSGDFDDNWDLDCGSESGYEVTYEFTPASDMTIAATTCGTDDFDTVLEIFEGCPDDGNSLDCSDDDGCDNNNESCVYGVDLFSGITYHIVVGGYSGQDGDYILNVVETDGEGGCYIPSCGTGDAENATCDNATPAAIPSSTQGYSADGLFPNVPDCDNNPESVGLWYSVIGDGNQITATTCNTYTNYDSWLNACTGDCGNLVCLAGNDDTNCDESSENVSRIQWCSEVGVEYLIVVSGYSGYTGDFQLDIFSTPGGVECTGVCECQTRENSFCTTAALPIPDTDGADTLTITINQPFEHIVERVTLCLDITHPSAIDDLRILLEAPGGTLITVWSQCCYGGADLTCTTFDDYAFQYLYDGSAPYSGSFRPSGNLSEFTGVQAQGDWKVHLIDHRNVGNEGTLNWACLTFITNQILPVELTSFDAIAGDSEITLNWSTASETDNDHFDILRDGTTLARITATNSPVGSDYTWSESNLVNGREYTYTLVSIDVSGAREELATVAASPSVSNATVTEYALHQNYPNPFNPETNIVFDLVDEGNVSLTVYNPLGQTVATLVNGTMESGRHTVEFNAADLPSGLYFYRLDAADFSAVKKMVLMK